MAKKVVILEDIVRLVQDTTGKAQKVVKDKDVFFIADESYNGRCRCIETEEQTNFVFDDESAVHVVLLESELMSPNSEHPFLYLEGAVNGILVVDNKCLTEEELLPYTVIID